MPPFYREDDDDSSDSDAEFIPESAIGPKAATRPNVAIQEIEKKIKIPTSERRHCVQLIEEVGFSVIKLAT